MAGELQLSFAPGKTVYTVIRDRNANVWNNASGTFNAYATAALANCTISLTEQGSASAFYVGTFPPTIPPGVYGIVGKSQVGGTVSEGDPTIAAGDQQWNGTALLPLSDLATSGQVGQIAPLRLARGVQVLNYKFYLRSAADHSTPFTSGICSGQILRDAGVSFTALQSGAFTEEGNGFFRLQALTSGDLLCNSASLLFTAAGISGGQSDPCPFTIITQRTSGQ